MMAVLMAMACLMAEVMAARIPLVARHLPTLPPLPLDMETLLTRPQRWSKRGACVASFSKACPRSGRARRSWRAIIHSNAIATCVCEPPMPIVSFTPGVVEVRALYTWTRLGRKARTRTLVASAIAIRHRGGAEFPIQPSETEGAE